MGVGRDLQGFARVGLPDKPASQSNRNIDGFVRDTQSNRFSGTSLAGGMHSIALLEPGTLLLEEMQRAKLTDLLPVSQECVLAIEQDEGMISLFVDGVSDQIQAKSPMRRRNKASIVDKAEAAAVRGDLGAIEATVVEPQVISGSLGCFGMQAPIEDQTSIPHFVLNVREPEMGRPSGDTPRELRDKVCQEGETACVTATDSESNPPANNMKLADNVRLLAEFGWSKGAIGHEAGNCRPCSYAHKGCTNGKDCNFCHFQHGRTSKPRLFKSKRDKLRLAAKREAALRELEELSRLMTDLQPKALLDPFGFEARETDGSLYGA